MVATFKERLIEAMKKNNMKAIDLSEKTGISKARISQYVNGVYIPKSKSTLAIAKALNVSETWLMGLDVPMERMISNNNTDLLLPSNYNPLEYRSSSDVVRYLRESKNMSRAEFANVLNCRESTIRKIEEGHKLVSINLARKISNCFGLPMPNTLFSATLYDRYQKLNKRDSAIVDTLLEPLDPDEEEYVTIQTAARGGDEPGEKKISKSEAEKLLSATPQNDKYD